MLVPCWPDAGRSTGCFAPAGCAAVPEYSYCTPFVPRNFVHKRITAKSVCVRSYAVRLRARERQRERSPRLGLASPCALRAQSPQSTLSAQRRAASRLRELRLFRTVITVISAERGRRLRLVWRAVYARSQAQRAPRRVHTAHFCVARLGLERNKAHSPSSSASMSGSRSSGSSSSSPPPLPLRDCDLGRMLARRFAAEVSCTSAHCRMAPRVFARPL